MTLSVLMTVAVSIAVAAQSAQDLYQRGLVQEHATGNLQQAIALYSQAAKAAATDRALAAKALVRIAGAHEKLGAVGQAQKTYAEVLSAYPELPHFLQEKKRWDADAIFDSNWHRHLRGMFS